MLKQMTQIVKGWKEELADDNRRLANGEARVALSTELQCVLWLGFIVEMELIFVLLSFFGTPAIGIVLGVVGIQIWYTHWSSRAVKAVLLGCVATASLFCLVASAFDAGHCQSVNPGSDLHCEFVLHAND